MKMPLRSCAQLAFGASILLQASSLLAQATTQPALTEQQRLIAESVIKQPINKPAAKLTRDGDIDPRWLKQHETFVKQAKAGDIRLLFVGDSITAGWRSHPHLWEKYFDAYAPANFGIGGDRTQHVLWRLKNGELEGMSPQVVVLMIGTNNINHPASQIAEGIEAIVALIREKQPQARILLLGIFPRGGHYHDGGRRIVRDTNTIIKNLHDGQYVHYMDLTSRFVQPDSSLLPSMFPDKLHPAEEGYVIWGEAIKPKLDELMSQQQR